MKKPQIQRDLRLLTGDVQKRRLSEVGLDALRLQIDALERRCAELRKHTLKRNSA